MGGILLDTNVLIAAERGEIDLANLSADEPIAMSAVVAHELLRGVARLPLGVRRTRSERWIETMLGGIPIIDYDVDIARVHAGLWLELAAARVNLSEADQMIAATALSLGYDLATRDSVFKQVPELNLRAW